MIPEPEIINPLAPKPSWFHRANTVILLCAQKERKREKKTLKNQKQHEGERDFELSAHTSEGIHSESEPERKSISS